MFENKESLVAVVKALDQVAYALHNFSLKTLDALGIPRETPAADAPALTEENEEPKELELEDVRAVFMAKTRAGHTQELKELLAKYGVDRLTKLDPAHYAEVLEIVESMGDSK